MKREGSEQMARGFGKSGKTPTKNVYERKDSRIEGHAGRTSRTLNRVKGRKCPGSVEGSED